MLIAGLGDVHTPRHVLGHDVASGFVEHWRGNTGVRGAEGLPVPVYCVFRGHEAIAYEARLQVDLGLCGI